MPVTPAAYPAASGRSVERLDMGQTGQIALPGQKTLFAEVLEVMFPAQLYPFCTAGAVADPSYYLDLLSVWSNAGNVCRYIVVGANINFPVLLGSTEWEERDGSNDVYARIPLYEYRYLDAVRVESTQNNSRPSESSIQKTAAEGYIVVKGDSLWSICRKFYGDESLANKLAAANGIGNLSLLYPGQVLTIPPMESLFKLSVAVYDSAGTTETTSGAKDAVRETLGLGPVKLQVSL